MRHVFLLPCLLFILLVSCQKEPAPVEPAQEIILQTDSTALNFTGNANSLDSLHIHSNTSWSISLSPASANWVTLSTSKGTGDARLYVSAQKNTSEVSRSVTIIIVPAGDSAKTVKIVVTQKPGSLIFWSKLYGGSQIDQLFTAVQTPDGGFIAVGQTRSTDGDVSTVHAGDQMWVLKVNANGEKLWQKTFGGEKDDYGYDIVAMPDGNYLIIGSTRSTLGDVIGSHGLSDLWLIKIDGQGNKLWQKTYGGSKDEHGRTIIPTGDGNYLLGGSATSTDGDATVNHGSGDTWIIKVDPTGKILWQKTYGGSDSESVPVIAKSPGGGYLLLASTFSNNGDVGATKGISDLWVIKIDDNGNKQWSKTYGGTKSEFTGSVIANSDGTYFIAGTTDSNDGDVVGSHGYGEGWLIKIDAVGNIVWQKTYGGTMFDNITDMMELSNGDYLLAGETTSSDGDVTSSRGIYDAWLIKINKAGTILWQKTYGGSDAEINCTIISTADGAFLLSGFSQSNDGDLSGNHGSSDAWLLKTNVP